MTPWRAPLANFATDQRQGLGRANHEMRRVSIGRSPNVTAIPWAVPSVRSSSTAAGATTLMSQV
jgi:hypothetical protein